MANLITVRLQRGEGQAWGFRLQGGKDFSSPLVLQRVNVGSVSDQVGLMPGDALVKVNNTEVFNLRHKEAQDVIVAAGNSFELTVSRGQVWRPSVTPTGSIPSPSPSLPGNITPVTKTSLAATPQPVQHIGSGHNQAAKPFPAAAAPQQQQQQPQVNGSEGPIKSIVNKQYNTPVAMYSDETIAETLSSQAEVLAGGVLGVNFKKNERVYSPANSEVYKLLHEQGNEPEPVQQQQKQQQSQHHQQQQQQQQFQQQNNTSTVTRHVMAPVDKPLAPAANGLPAGQNICNSCDRLIVGVFVRIKDKNLHADCFKCATCGTSLKNQGYFNLNNKLYCDIHARLAALQSPPPGTNGMVPIAIIKPGQKSGVQAISAALNAHANLNGRSQSPYANNNQNNITPKPFGAPLPVSSLAQVQPPASYPPVAGSVPTPFAAAITGQAPAPAPAPVPTFAAPPPAASYPPVAAPAPAPVAAPPAGATQEQPPDAEQPDYDDIEQVQKPAESPAPTFIWPPKRIEDETIPTATPIYVPPPETQKAVAKQPIMVPPPPKAKEKSKSPPEKVVEQDDKTATKSVQSKSAPELSRRKSDTHCQPLEEESYETYTATTTSTSASSEEYRMYSTQTSQPIVTYYDTPIIEMEYPFSSGQRSAQASTGVMSDASYTHFVFRDTPLPESVEPSIEPSVAPELLVERAKSPVSRETKQQKRVEFLDYSKELARFLKAEEDAKQAAERQNQKFGHEIPSQMENMPVPSGRISMTDALATAPQRPYTPFTEVKFERSDMYQKLLKEQPSIQVDPDSNFSAFASVGGNRSPVPFKPIMPEIRRESIKEPEPEPEPERTQEPEPEPEPVVEKKQEIPRGKAPPYPRKDAGSDHYSLAPRRESKSPLNHPAEIPSYQRKWYNLPTQNPPHTPEPEELRQNVPLAFVDTHSKSHLAKPIAQPVNIKDQVRLKKTQPFTTIQNRTIPVIQTPLEDDAELAQYNNAHLRLQAKGVIDRGQSFTPSLILTKHPTAIPYYQHQLGFEEYFAESKEFDGRRTPQPVRRSPAFGPPPNPLKAHVPPSREGIPVESGLYLSMGKLHGVPWYTNKDHIPADIQQKMQVQQHGLGGGYDATRQHRAVSYQEKPMTVRTEQRNDMTVQTRSQESALREQTSSERTIASASQVGNALIQKRTRIVEEHEHMQAAKTIETAKFSTKIKEDEAPPKGFVAQQTRRFSGQDDALNVPPQLQEQPPQMTEQPVQQLAQQQSQLPPQPQPVQSFPPPAFPSAPASFPSTSLFSEPIVDRFPSRSARKASILLPKIPSRSPTPTSGFKAQFNEFIVGEGGLPPLPLQREDNTKDLIQSWPPQLPSYLSNTNPTVGAPSSMKPPLPSASAPTAPAALNGHWPSINNSSIGFSSNNRGNSQTNNTDRSDASAGSGALNKGRAACSTTAPTRGRGVLNKAVAPGGRVPLCGCCNQQIRGPFITALGRIWCPDHFICHNANCKRPLAEIGFVEEKGDLYCEYCFEEFLAPVCSKCNNRVKGDCLNAIGKQFHPECFKCTYCGKLFGNSPFFLEEGDPYCENDWNELFTTKCFACGFPVEAGDKWVEALNNNYHSQCFNCTSCKKNLEGQSFFAKGGRPFCKNHAR